MKCSIFSHAYHWFFTLLLTRCAYILSIIMYSTKTAPYDGYENHFATRWRSFHWLYWHREKRVQGCNFAVQKVQGVVSPCLLWHWRLLASHIHAILCGHRTRTLTNNINWLNAGIYNIGEVSTRRRRRYQRRRHHSWRAEFRAVNEPQDDLCERCC